MTQFLKILSLTLLLTLSLVAQQQSVESIGVPWKGTPGITRTVSEIMAEGKTQTQTVLTEMREAGREFPNFRFPKNNPSSPSVSKWPIVDNQKLSDALAKPFTPQAVGVSFLGAHSSESGFIPPDCVGAVGPTQVVMVVNGRIKVFDKTGVLGGLNTDTDNFFSSVGGTTDGTSDPHVRYDRLSGRWFIVIITVNNTPNNVLIAVSNTSTITNTSSFTFYKFQFDIVGTTPNSDTGGFADYPTLGVDANALYIGTNIFNAAGTAFLGTTGFVVRKSDLLAGTLTVTAFRQLSPASGAGVYTPQGVDNDDPSATEGYFIGVDNANFGLLQIRRVSTPGGTPSVSGNISVTVPATAFPILQVVKGSTATHRLDGLEDRLFAAHIKKNKITGVSSLWTAHNIEVNTSGVATSGGGRNGSRWYEIQNMTSTPTLFQSGTLFDAAASNPRGYWIPSVAMSGQGHMALGCSFASTNDNAGVAVAGRFSSDVLGTIQSPTLAQTSSTSYNAQAVDGQRWGDFSQTAVDPNDDMTMWTFQEYCDATNSWGLRVIQLTAPLPATPVTTSPASAATGTTNLNVTVTGTSASGSGFFDPGTGYANHVSASVNGGGVTVNSVTFTDPTHVTLNISIAGGATTGSRTISVTDPDGQSTTSAAGIFTITTGSCPTITLSPSTVPAGAVGSSYNQTFTGGGGTAAYTFAVTTGSLPSGITLSSGGVLSGTPVINGTFNFTVTATDANSCTGNQAYSLVVTGCPTITLAPSTLPGGNVSTAYNQTITSSGGTSPYTYTVTTGTLPAGLTLSSDGVLSGTPTTAGTSSVTITATDATACTGNRAYSITICPAIILSPSTLPNGTVSTAYNQTITTSGGTSPYTYTVTTGSLPAGLTLSSGGVLSGTPTTAGASSFTVTATDAASCTGNRAYSVTINNAANSISLTTMGSAYTQDFNTLASSGTSSTLPAGWSFTETGASADTTYAAGTGSITTGNTYSFGPASSIDRALGGLLSGNLVPTIGASFKNNTGSTITSLAVSYFGEEWRLGAASRNDTIKFQYSLNATSDTNGTWTSVSALNYVTTNTTAPIGAKDGNTLRTSITATISSLSIVNGATFRIRWTDVNVAGSDDGLAVDDFSLTPSGAGSPTNPTVTAGANPSTVYAGNATLLTATVHPGTTPTSTNIAVAVNLSSIGGSSTQTMVDNGTNGDVTSGDSIYSYLATVSLGTSSGGKTLNVSVTDGESRSASTSINITVPACPAITLTSPPLPGGTTGTAYNQNISASGGTPPYSFAITSGSLPAGLSLSSGGVISGTPSASGTSNFTVTATDSNHCTGNQAYSVTIQPPACPTITITSSALPNGTTGVSYSYSYTAGGGVSPYSFAVTSGSLPSGLTLSSAGVIGGTPASAGKAVFTVLAADNNNCTGSRIDSIIVTCPVITLSPAALDSGVAGTAYSNTVSAGGGTAPYSYSITAGSLPAGLTLSTTGTVSGTPLATGNFSFTVTATDSFGCTGTKNYSITIICPAISITPAILPAGITGTTYNQSLSGSGGRAPYTFSVVSGSLPAGLSLSSIGLISGTPTLAETLSCTIGVIDSFGCSANRVYSIEIQAPAQITVGVSLMDKWNMISVPVIPADSAVSSIYPGAASNAFSFSTAGGYASRTFLRHGIGYWLKFNSSHTQSITGVPILSDTLDVEVGWNMMGSISQSFPVTQITSLPGGIVTSQFYGYGGTYTTSDSIVLGKSYWVKVNQPGKLVLTSSTAAPVIAGRINIVPTTELPPPMPNGNETTILPATFALGQNYPNPFNPSTDIRYQISDAGKVTLKIYNMLGNEVALLVNEVKQPGFYTATWNANKVPSGVYYYKLIAGSFTETRKMLLVK